MSVLFLATQEFPDQSANATRIVNLAKLFEHCGEKAILIGTCYHSEVLLSGKYDGLTYFHINATNYLSLPRLKRKKYMESLWIAAMEMAWKKEHYSMIVVSGFINQSNKFLINYAKEKNISIIYNSVEWYQGNNEVFMGVGGKVKFLYNRYNLMIRHVKMGNIIGISTLLTNYYKDRNCNVIHIPTIVDKEKYCFVKKNDNHKMIVSYAGSPAKKDYIGNAIKALLLLSSKERSQIELHLYGVNNNQLVSLGISKEIISDLSGTLWAHGRIPYSEVQDKIATSDFTVLLRPNLRYANAGFPTKVGESMMCGTPVIANLTSDLKLYIRDGETGIVVANESEEACAEGFRKALQMSSSDRERLRNAARLEAEKAFSYMSYQDEMKTFIKDLKKL